MSKEGVGFSNEVVKEGYRNPYSTIFFQENEDNGYGMNIKLVYDKCFFESKVWNKVFGTETLNPQFLSRNKYRRK